jgi:hypothetical protein
MQSSKDIGRAAGALVCAAAADTMPASIKHGLILFI